MGVLDGFLGLLALRNHLVEVVSQLHLLIVVLVVHREEESVLLQLLQVVSGVLVIIQRTFQKVPQNFIVDHSEQLKFATRVQNPIKKFKGVLACLSCQVGKDHLEQGQTKAKGIELLGGSFLQVPFALVEF